MKNLWVLYYGYALLRSIRISSLFANRYGHNCPNAHEQFLFQGETQKTDLMQFYIVSHLQPYSMEHNKYSRQVVLFLRQKNISLLYEQENQTVS